MQQETDDIAPHPARVTPSLAFVLALGCGLIAANLYYAQPLTGPIGASFALPPAAAGLLVTVTQLGYGLGLIFVVPLGDIAENRRLAVAAILAAALALLVMSLASVAAIFLGAALTLGIAATAVQILLPYATRLAPEAQRGRVLGLLTSGLMLGIAVARPIASLVAYYANWRVVFLLSALFMLLTALLLRLRLPAVRPRGGVSYLGVLRSLPSLFCEVPILRRRAAYHAALYGSFSLFWTAAPLLLASHRFRLDQGAIGLFAFAGAGGVVIAPIAGWIADCGFARSTTASAMSAVLLAFIIAALGDAWHSLGLLVLAAVLIDAGLVTNFVLSQRMIYGARPESRGRLGGLFTALFFLGGALGSALGAASFAGGGWRMTVTIGVALAATALILFATEVVGRMARESI